MPDDQQPPPPPATVHVTSVKLPEFWTEQPLIWFTQAEAQFAIKRITVSLTKFYYVVAALPQGVAAGVMDILRAPPANEPYETLKSRLEQSYSISEYNRAEQLINLPALGDRKPSHMMNSMLSLLPEGHKPGFLFKYLFLNRLPEGIRSHLMNIKTEQLRDLAAIADQLWSATNLPPPVCPVQTEHGPQEINALPPTRNYRRPEQSNRRPEQDRRPEQSNRRPEQNRRQEQHNPRFCHYHNTYGEKAHRCTSPCSYQTPGNSNSGGRR